MHNKIDPNNGEKQRRGASRIGRIAGGGAAPSPLTPHPFFFKLIQPSPCWEVDDNDHHHNNHNHHHKHNHNHNQHHNRHNRNNY